MRVAWVGALASVFVGVGALAQTAPFKCPKPNTIVEFADGTQTTWQAADGNACMILSKLPNRDAVPSTWYAPTLFIRADAGKAFGEQLKAWTLWPLAVGKKLTGRYDGPGSTPGSQGSWDETVTVDSYEKLSTKAGTFDMFVVTRQEQALSHNYKSTFRQWYAAEPGVTVKFSFSDNQGTSRASEATAIRQ